MSDDVWSVVLQSDGYRYRLGPESEASAREVFERRGALLRFRVDKGIAFSDEEVVLYHNDEVVGAVRAVDVLAYLELPLAPPPDLTLLSWAELHPPAPPPVVQGKRTDRAWRRAAKRGDR
jgi:hypothetical protein